jgi:hypothetical protein
MNVRRACALFIAAALLLQFVPLARVTPVLDSRPRADASVECVCALDVCSEDGVRGAREQPVLPAQPAPVPVPSAWEVRQGGRSFAFPEGFPRLPLRPPRA